ncbi:MAG: DUF4825 domain-containing protein [Clostridiales bacterium]|nr:DUF4825 domain-containing protein [Clostridiales bacterium]MBD9198682.1 DUF4825 domain-containing protein [Clostridiales bacterium]
MKNDLTCGVVRDLLPSYVEGLTSQETNTAVERHLADCPDCTRLRADLAGETPPPPEEVKEVDYLKKVKRRGRRRVVAAVAVTVLVLALGIAAKLFLIGSPANWDTWENYNFTARTNVPNQLDISFYPDELPDTAYCHWNVTNENGIVCVNARKVLPSVFHDTSEHWEHISLSGVREVWVANQLVWQGGVVISPQMDRVYQTKTPYVGNASAVGQVVSAGRFDWLGDYTMELQTSAQPYRLTLNFSDSQSSQAFHPQDLYQDMAAALAVIGNLDEIECAFQDEDSQPWSYVLTVEELNQALPQIVSVYNERSQKDYPLYDSVKDYGNSCADLQQLYEAMWWAIELGAYTPQVQS